MEYKLEKISPVKNRVIISVPNEEVRAAINATALQFKDSVQLDGFRKGKAPLKLVEKRFHDKIYDEAKTDLINVHINNVLQELDTSPLSGIVINDEDVVFDPEKDFNYKMEFEVLPEFDLPQYKGLEVEQIKTLPDPIAVDKMLEKLRTMGAKLVPVEGNAPAKDGQVANIDFEILKDDEETSELKTQDFDLEIGTGNALKEFEDLVKGIPAGNIGEGKITFPEDFIDKSLAGKTARVKIKVNAVKERDKSYFDNMLAKQENGRENIIKSLENSFLKEMTEVYKGMAQRALIDQMLKLASFDVPESLTDFETRHLLAERENELARQGRTLAALGKSAKEQFEELRPAGLERARMQTLLMSIAKKENLEVTDEELSNNIYDMCQKYGYKPKEFVETLHQNGLISRYRNHLLADKAMDLVYSSAKITMVDPKPENKDEKMPENEITHKDDEQKIADNGKPETE